MAKAKKQIFSSDALNIAANQMSIQDEKRTELAKQDRQQRAYVSLSSIKEREHDTRPCNPTHIENLRESIAVLGLIEPLVVDENHRLLAGAHRLKAIQSLKETQLKEYNLQFKNDLIPVRIMDFKADENPKRALEIEVAENEKRRDYTPKEVRELAERLKKSGYKSTRGKPKAGEKSLAPALQVIVGKSRASIVRYLSNQDKNLNASNDSFRKPEKILKKLQRDLNSLQRTFSDSLENKELAEIEEKLPEFLATVELALAKLAEKEEN